MKAARRAVAEATLTRTDGRGLSVYLVWLAPALIFLLHAAWLSHAQGHGAVDDAWIAFRYVQQWQAGHGLVFNPGEWVEGYTSPAWIMVLAGLSSLGLELLPASLLAGCVCGLVVLGLSGRLAWSMSKRSELGVATALLLALDGGFVRWAVDGLETQLFALWLVLGVHSLWMLSTCRAEAAPAVRPWSLHGQAGLTGLWLGLAALTRPEGLGFVLLCALFCVADAWHGSRSRLSEGLHSALLLIGSAGCVLLPHLLWRQATYGDWVANTAYLKVEPGLVSAVRGIRYCVLFVWERWPLWVGLAVTVLLSRGGRSATIPPRARALLALMLGGMTVFIVGVGGDWMGWSRFYVPVLPFLYCWAAERLVSPSQARPPLEDDAHAPGCATASATAQVASSSAGRRALLPAQWGGRLLACMLLLSSSLLGEHPRLVRAGLEHQERAAVSDYLLKHARPSDVLLTEELGEIPFQTGLRALDVYGLIDKHIAKNGEWDADSPPGHQKTDLNYSLSKQPDWLVMASFHETWQRHASAPPDAPGRFPALRLYEPVPLTLPEGRLELYKRR